MPLLSVVVFGNGGVGKSCLVVRYAQGHYTTMHDPTVENSCRKAVVVNDEEHILNVLDTAGGEQYTALKEHYMKIGEGFVLCYDPTSRESFDQLGKYLWKTLVFYSSCERLKDTIPLCHCCNQV